MNTRTTTPDSAAMNAHLSLSASVLMIPRCAGLRAGHDNVVEVLVRFQAPDAPAGHDAARPPQALGLVIDRSGSMSGRPLEEAKRCAKYVLGKLRSSDAVSLVASKPPSAPVFTAGLVSQGGERGQPGELLPVSAAGGSGLISEAFTVVRQRFAKGFPPHWSAGTPLEILP